MKMNERYARLICESRGADPDQPLTVTSPPKQVSDGGDGVAYDYEAPKTYDNGFQAYLELADNLLALHKRTPKKS